MTIVIALILDALLGDPRLIWSTVPHPVVLIGRAIDWADNRFNDADARKPNGIIFCAALCLAALTIGWIIPRLPFGFALEIIVVAIFLAQRSLVDHVGAVADALRLSTGDGRIVVSKIVGRDTKGMDDTAVARAAIESAAENFSDGLVAPVFWFLIAGLPGLLMYKAVNTADSIVGHRTERHEEFGWASARLDDVLNWVPARLTAIVMAALHNRTIEIGRIRNDAKYHRSPNAGWPEASMAHILGIRLSGPRRYDGIMSDETVINPDGRQQAGAAEVDEAVAVLWRTWAVFLIAALLLAVF